MSEYPRLLYRGPEIKRVESAEEEAAAEGFSRDVPRSWHASYVPGEEPPASEPAEPTPEPPKRKGRK